MAADLAIKEPCRVASTENIADLSGLLIVDEVTVAVNNRVLVRAQTNPVENGIYVAASGTWLRASDFDGAGEVTGGTQVVVTAGTLFADSRWRVAGDVAVTPGSSAISFDPEFLQSGTGSVPRTLQDKARDILSIEDKGSDSDVALALQLAADDIPSGGEVHVPRGILPLNAGVIFDGQRFNLRGQGPQATSLEFDPGSDGVAITLDTPGLGGQAQSSLTGLGFVAGSQSDGIDRTAIKLVNVANVNVDRCAVVNFGNGDSVGIHTAGRQFARIRDCDLACASPVLIDVNDVHETLAGDYLELYSCELLSTAAAKSCIEMKSGTVLSNMSVRNTALVGGRNGVLRDDSTSIGVSNHIEFWNVRAEQGLDPTGWSFDLRSSAQNIQNLVFGEVLTDAYRSGIRLSRVLAGTMINTAFPQGTLLVEAKIAGTAGNSIATTVAGTAWGFFFQPTLFEGDAGPPAKKAHGPFALVRIPAINDTVMIGSRTYTFVDALTAADQVKIGVDAPASAANLVAAITAGAGAGTAYGSGTVAHADVTAMLMSALDVEMISGSFLSMIGCSSNAGGQRRIANGRAIMRVRSNATGAPIGPFELWDHFAPSVNGTVYNYETMRPVEQQGIDVIGFAFTAPAVNSTLILPMANTNSMEVDVELVARAANGRLALRFQKNGSVSTVSADGIFAATPTSGKIYHHINGTQLQLIGNNLAAATPIRVEIRQ